MNLLKMKTLRALIILQESKKQETKTKTKTNKTKTNKTKQNKKQKQTNKEHIVTVNLTEAEITFHTILTQDKQL